MGISLGQIVGSGVVIFTVTGISLTGHGVAWAFLLALGIVILPSISIAALGSAIPSTGGTYVYVRDLLGPRMAFLYLALLVAGQLVLASYALGFAEYALALMPNLNPTWVAVAVMTGCFCANLLGIKTAARLQSFMVFILLVSLLLFVVFGLPQVTNFSPFFDRQTVLPKGIEGFIAAGFLLRYSMIGSEFISELGGETQEPGKNIPKAMFTSLAIVTVLYVAIAVVASGVDTGDQGQEGSLAVVAKQIFPTWLYLFFVAGGVMLALVTTLNSIFAWCTKGLYMAIGDGWLPQSMAKTNRFGTPYILLSIFYVVGMFPLLSGMSLTYVNILGNNVGIIFGIIPVIALFNLYVRFPDAYEKATFKLGKIGTRIVPVLAFVIYAYGVYQARQFIGTTGLIVLASYSTLVAFYIIYRYDIRGLSPKNLS